MIVSVTARLRGNHDAGARWWLVRRLRGDAGSRQRRSGHHLGQYLQRQHCSPLGRGIAAGGPATISINQSRIVGNTATNAYGGGLYVAYPSKSGLTVASVLLQNSEIADNTAALAGGGINHANVAASAQTSGTEATLALVNATVSGNTVSGASGNAAAVAIAGNAGLSIDNSTIAYNNLSAASSGAAITRSACTVSGSGGSTQGADLRYRQLDRRDDQCGAQWLL